MPNERKPTFRHPIDLVASIATTILTTNPNRNFDVMSCKNAANYAVRILDACSALAEEEVAQREAQRLEKAEGVERESLQKKYPQGMPWNKALLYITEKRSEREALSPLKFYMRYALSQQGMHIMSEKRLKPPLPFIPWQALYKLPPEWLMDGPDADKEVVALQNAVEAKIKVLIRDGFRTSDVVDQKNGFREWYKKAGISNVRSVAARKRRLKN